MSRVARWMPIPVAAAWVLAMVGCAEPARFKRSADVRAAHQASGAVEAKTENGSITVSRGTAAEVEIRAEVRAVTQARADATVVAAERAADGSLQITVRWPEGKRHSNEACSLDIKVPEAVGVRLFTSNGDIDAKGMAGEARMKTSNGAVVVSEHAGSVDAQSSNGDIDVRGVTGAVTADTSNGSVTIVLGPGGGPMDVETSNGSIRVELAAGFVGEIEAGTSNGSIDATGGPMQIAKQGQRNAVMTIGAGGAKSRLRTSNGSVRVVLGTE